MITIFIRTVSLFLSVVFVFLAFFSPFRNPSAIELDSHGDISTVSVHDLFLEGTGQATFQPSCSYDHILFCRRLFVIFPITLLLPLLLLIMSWLNFRYIRGFSLALTVYLFIAFSSYFLLLFAQYFSVGGPGDSMYQMPPTFLGFVLLIWLFSGVIMGIRLFFKSNYRLKIKVLSH
ncbi:MAG: hypothetical protein JWM56_1400 [Candidatus Peribacteria bacterium]|nr:hypothetical protein [Candidatus Peribacteria bacterium]